MCKAPEILFVLHLPMKLSNIDSVVEFIIILQSTLFGAFVLTLW